MWKEKGRGGYRQMHKKHVSLTCRYQPNHVYSLVSDWLRSGRVLRGSRRQIFQGRRRDVPVDPVARSNACAEFFLHYHPVKRVTLINQHPVIIPIPKPYGYSSFCL